MGPTFFNTAGALTETVLAAFDSSEVTQVYLTAKSVLTAIGSMLGCLHSVSETWL
jgi:hypothetical protein